MATTELAPPAFSIDDIVEAVRAALMQKHQCMAGANGQAEGADDDPPDEDAGLPLADRRAISEAQAASYLNISVSGLRKQRMNGERDGHMPLIPYVRLGRRIAYLRDDLDKALDSHRVAPAEAGDAGSAATSKEQASGKPARRITASRTTTGGR